MTASPEGVWVGAGPFKRTVCGVQVVGDRVQGVSVTIDGKTCHLPGFQWKVLAHALAAASRAPGPDAPPRPRMDEQ